MDNRKKKASERERVREGARVIVVTLSVAGMILLLIGMGLKNTEERNVFAWIGGGLLSGAIIFKLFRPGVGYKPTREELEES